MTKDIRFSVTDADVSNMCKLITQERMEKIHKSSEETGLKFEISLFNDYLQTKALIESLRQTEKVIDLLTKDLEDDLVNYLKDK